MTRYTIIQHETLSVVKWTRDDIIWAAGLLEGEGCFTIVHEKNGKVRASIYCSMTDKDVIEKLQRILGVGSISEVAPRSDKKRGVLSVKIQFRLGIHRQSYVFAVCAAILPFMGERRSKKIMEVMKCIRERPPHSVEKIHALRMALRQKMRNEVMASRRRMCSLCRLVKPLDEFYRLRDVSPSRLPFSSACKECGRARNRRYRMEVMCPK